jgi:hypothetical protein
MDAKCRFQESYFSTLIFSCEACANELFIYLVLSVFCENRAPPNSFDISSAAIGVY